MNRLGAACGGGLLLICSLAVALASVALSPAWYEKNCQWHGRCAQMSGSSARAHIINLRDYFLHRADLAGRWSDKERRHLSEVRGIYKMLALVAALALCVLAVLLWLRPTWVKRAALVNYALVLSLVLIVPAFGVFWRDLFHPLLFSNYDWLTNTGDVTWYITPRVFFRNSLIAMIILALLCNTAIYLVSKYRMARVSA